ncbi:MAG TPA: hypothetical protein VFZ16_16150, partial [Hyphomicrobiaceae bacterium]|nr:hypothetical protein [Hyphomicrobiaceae bacterium]
DRYFDLFERFHVPPYHPKWKSVNLAANVPGWVRYGVAEEKLRKMTAAKQSARGPIQTSQSRQRAGGNDDADQEKLFQQFLEWSKKQKR